MNILWIVLDSLRADRLGCSGSARPTTPHLDRFARGAVRLDQLLSPHIPTHPAHTTFFTGQDVFTHQIVAQGGYQEPDPWLPLLPVLLGEAGWFTGAVDNIGRWMEPAFERYVHYPRWNHDGSLPWRNGEEVTARALELLEAARTSGRPWFLFLHYWDPHTPYLPPPPFDRMFYTGDERDPRHTSMEPVWRSPWFANYFREWLDGVRDLEYVKAQYDAAVAYCDLCVAHVLHWLEEHDLLDETAVLIHADHGEELDDHGMWFDHHGLYETNVHVPGLIRLPGAARGGTVFTPPVAVWDLAPTMLQAVELSHLAEGMRGRSLLPLLDGSSGTAETLYLTECTWLRKRAWRTPRWKLIQALETDIYGTAELELYDLAADPGERHNLAEDRPEVVAELRAALEEHVRSRLEETGRPDPLVAQADALRIWQPRFIAGRSAA